MLSATHVDGRGRQNPLRDKEEFVAEAMGAIEAAFGAAWLAKGGTPLHQLWARSDWFATAQLFLLGCGLLRMAHEPAWIRGQVAEIKQKENQRRGHMFELVAVPYFATHGARVLPTKRNAKGYDAIIDHGEAGQLHLSLKNFGITHEEREFLGAASRLEAHFKDQLVKHRRAALGLCALSEEFAGPAAWSALSEAVPRLVASGPTLQQIGPWAVQVHDLPMRCGPYSARMPSWQIIVHAAHHANERQTVIDKLSKGVTNARQHASGGTETARTLLVRLHENADLPSFIAWANEAILETDRGLLEAILLYQPGLVDLVADDSRAISHNFSWAGNGAYLAWLAGSEQRLPRLDMPIGLCSDRPAHRRLISDSGGIDLRAGYFHQAGRYHNIFPFGEGHYDLSSPAAGIVRQIYLEDQSGGIGVAPIAPLDGRFILFD